LRHRIHHLHDGIKFRPVDLLQHFQLPARAVIVRFGFRRFRSAPGPHLFFKRAHRFQQADVRGALAVDQHGHIGTFNQQRARHRRPGEFKFPLQPLENLLKFKPPRRQYWCVHKVIK